MADISKITVLKVVDKYGEPKIAIKVRKKLQKNHPKLAKYILEYGKNKGIHKVKSLKSRKIWFSLGELKIAPLLFPAEYWRNSFVVFNKYQITVDKRFYLMTKNIKHPKLTNDELTLLMLSILNSHIGSLMRELTGRTASGQGMNRNECMVYEANSLRIPDPRKVTKVEAIRIIGCFTKIVDKEIEMKDINDSSSKKFLTLTTEIELNKRELTKEVLKILNYESRVEELIDAVNELLNIRERGKGLNKKIPFTYSGKIISPKIKGAKIMKSNMNSSSNTLDLFLKK